MTIAVVIPSGSTNGKPIKVVATATAGTAFHVATSTAGVFDETWLWLANTSGTDVVATVELGGVTSPDNLTKHICPANETILAIAGVRLTGGVTVGVFAATANVITMHGNVNRIS